MKKSGIYRIKNIITSESYVGSSVNIEMRFKQHQRRLKSNKHDNPKLQNSYNKYGEDAFVYNVLDYCENILEREQMFLDSGAFKFNICLIAAKPPDATGRKYTRSEETRAKTSVAMKGKVRSEETRAKISAALNGHKHSEETRTKIGAVHKGKVVSAETKAKMRESAKARWKNLKNKNSLTIEELNNGNY